MSWLLLALMLARAEPATDLTLRTPSRQVVSLSDHQGDVILVAFWATWCGSCGEELSRLQTLHETYGGDGLKIVAIAMDDARSVGRVRPRVRARGYTFQVLVDPAAEASSVYNPNKQLPWLVLIDRDFQRVGVFNAFTPLDQQRMEGQIKTLLASPARDR